MKVRVFTSRGVIELDAPLDAFLVAKLKTLNTSERRELVLGSIDKGVGSGLFVLYCRGIFETELLQIKGTGFFWLPSRVPKVQKKHKQIDQKHKPHRQLSDCKRRFLPYRFRNVDVGSAFPAKDEPFREVWLFSSRLDLKDFKLFVELKKKLHINRVLAVLADFEPYSKSNPKLTVKSKNKNKKQNQQQ